MKKDCGEKRSKTWVEKLDYSGRHNAGWTESVVGVALLARRSVADDDDYNEE